MFSNVFRCSQDALNWLQIFLSCSLDVLGVVGLVIRLRWACWVSCVRWVMCSGFGESCESDWLLPVKSLYERQFAVE